jgi:hypothetical protein
MTKKLFILLLIFSIIITTTYAQDIEIVEENNDNKQKTVVEFEVDNNKSVDLYNYLGSSTGSGGGVTVTVHSYQKLTKAPVTLSLKQGNYKFMANNNKKYGKSPINIEANGGYQKWKIFTGDTKKARRGGAWLWVSIIGTTTAGLSAMMLGLTDTEDVLYFSEKSQLDYFTKELEEAKEDNDDEKIDEYQELYDKQLSIVTDMEDEQERKEKLKTIGMISSFAAAGVFVTVAIPSIAAIRKNRLKAKLIETRKNSIIQNSNNLIMQ